MSAMPGLLAWLPRPRPVVFTKLIWTLAETSGVSRAIIICLSKPHTRQTAADKQHYSWSDCGKHAGHIEFAQCLHAYEREVACSSGRCAFRSPDIVNDE